MIIIFGYSKFAALLAYNLKNENIEFMIIEPLKMQRDFAISDGYTSHIYDYECYDDDELLSLGIDTKINTLFCTHNDFNKNLLISLSARNLNKNLQIIAYSTNNNESKKLKLAGVTTAINPYETAGLQVFRKIHKPIALKIIDNILYKNSSLEVQEILIKKNSKLDGKLFHELNIINDYNLILLGIQDKEISNEFIFSSRGIDHKIDEDDILVVLGYKNDILDFIKNINTK
jgi:voltage-gated potassium channel